MLHLFTHTDADGYGAAFLVLNKFREEHKKSGKELKESDYKIHYMNYGKPFPLDQIKEGDIVFITDYSIEPDEMIKLNRITPYVIWIDHHISSIKKYEDWNDLAQEAYGKGDYIIDGLRFNRVSGTALTWLYLNNGWNAEQTELEIKDIGEKATYDDMMSELEKAPMWIKLINDWDVWNHNLKETKPFIMALNNCLSMETMEKLNDDVILKQGFNWMKLTSIGRTYMEFRDSWASQLREHYGYSTVVIGPDNQQYSMYCLNVGNANSDYSGEELLNQFDIVCHYCFNGSRYVYSFYSNKENVDCAKLCQYFGVDNGGGHKGAAGFRHKDLLFKKEA